MLSFADFIIAVNLGSVSVIACYFNCL